MTCSPTSLVRNLRAFRTLRTLVFSALSAAASTGLAPAADAIHGPFCSWYRDPTTTMTVQWIHRAEKGRASEGVEGEWATGNAGFGYGDGDDTTTFEMFERFDSLFIRTTFDVPEGTPPSAKVILNVLYDDAFIAYLNGREVKRVGVAHGSGEGARGFVAHDAKQFEKFTLGRAGDLLKPGRNILAVEGHNFTIESSDFSLHPTLAVQGADSVDEPLIDRKTRWQYLANMEPKAGWTRTIANIPGAGKIGGSGRAPRFRLEFRPGVGDGRWTAAKLDRRPFADTGNTVYCADLSGLTPATAYDFRLVDAEAGDAVPEVRKFRTAPSEFTGGVHFVTGGDMFHDRAMLDAMNAQCGAQSPLFALLGGDLAYANGRTAGRWYAWVDSWTENCIAEDGGFSVPMIVAIGNHEVDGGSQPRPPEDAKFFYSLFNLPDGVSNYAVDFGSYLSLIILDSDHSQPVKRQTAWLDAALETRGEIPRIFACYHRPTYGTPVKVNQFNVRNEWVPVFEKHHIDAVFENDHHVYKRSKLIAGDEEDPENGVLYIGDGAWGVNVREISKDTVQKLDYLEKWASKRHLLAVTLNENDTLIQGVEADGNVIDSTVLPVRRPVSRPTSE